MDGEPGAAGLPGGGASAGGGGAEGGYGQAAPAAQTCGKWLVNCSVSKRNYFSAQQAHQAFLDIKANVDLAERREHEERLGHLDVMAILV